MKNIIRTILIAILLIFLGCAKLTQNQKKETLLIASQNIHDFSKVDRTLKIYSDSSFVFIDSLKETNHTKIETFEGMTQIKNDTIKFFPFRLSYNGAETAVLKNGFIEFCDGEYPDRIKIDKTSLKVKNQINFQNFKDYAVFTFYNKFNSSDNQDLINYDLNTEELTKIDNILKKTFNNKRLRKYSEYIKQIESVKDKTKQNLIYIHCFCKESYILESYKYFQISMNDGGNCNIFIILNLTTQKIELFKIAGSA